MAEAVMAEAVMAEAVMAEAVMAEAVWEHSSDLKRQIYQTTTWRADMAITVGSRGTSSEINVTPMIDVLLVLLIICMVLLPQQSTGESANIPLPSLDTPAPLHSAPIVIRIQHVAASERPALKINEEEVSWQELVPHLQQIYARRNDKVAFLKGDPEIDFQYIAEAIDIVHRAGVTQVGLMGSKDPAP